MNKKVSGIIEYISYLMKKYGEIQQEQMKNTYRVANITKTDEGFKIIYQVIGKSTFMHCTPEKIMSNNAFMEGFSKKDIQTISFAQAHNENQNQPPDLKLIEQQFNQDIGKIQFTLEDKEGNTTSKTAAEIVTDKKTVKKLDKEVAMNIGYIAGYEHSQNDPNN